MAALLAVTGHRSPLDLPWRCIDACTPAGKINQADHLLSLNLISSVFRALGVSRLAIDDDRWDPFIEHCRLDFVRNLSRRFCPRKETSGGVVP